MTMFLGIDPGASGGLALLDEEGSLHCRKSPADIPGRAATLGEMSDFPGLTVVLERLQAMPQRGHIASFKLGRDAGIWEGLIVAFKLDYVLVSPQKWKRHFDLIKKPKKQDRLLAQELYPGTKITNATADAVLLARYGREMWKSGPISKA